MLFYLVWVPDLLHIRFPRRGAGIPIPQEIFEPSDRLAGSPDMAPKENPDL